MTDIEALIAAMTLSEKLGQLTMTAAQYAVTGPFVAGDASAAIRAGDVGNLLNIYGPERVREVQRLAVRESRLGIPLLIGLDVLHGHRTMFPTPLSEACAFDEELWEATARSAAEEAAADGVNLVFAPMLDVSRDPRWGRSVEGPGEDPYVASRFARAKVRGFQGDDLRRPDRVAACLKHFCAYGPVQAGREYAYVDVSERSLREIHLPPFAAGVAAGAVSVMPAFTDLAGVPMTAHARLLTGELRGALGFRGLIISDYNAIAELIRHGVAADHAEAAALALNAGVDVDMMADAFRLGLPVALERGLVAMATIDASVRRVLALKEALGLFEDPYARRATAEPQAALRDRRALARRAALRSMVMLKNETGAPPLAGARRIAVIGPLADASEEMRGPWPAASTTEGHIAPLAGLRTARPDLDVRFARGVAIEDPDESGLREAVACVRAAEVVLLCLGEAAVMSGEAASRAHPGLPGRQSALADAVFDAAAERGTPVATVLFGGRPLIVPHLAERSQTLLFAGWPGSEAGAALAALLLGDESPVARSCVTFARSLGQVPIFYAARPSGRPADPRDHYTSKYLDGPNSPLFPFGAGLTFGRLALRGLAVSPRQATEADTIAIEARIANEGDRPARETLFLFTRDPVASVTRPLLELRGFAALDLAPGEEATLRFALPAADLRFPGIDLAPVFEAGATEIYVGPSAEAAQLLRAEVELARAPRS